MVGATGTETSRASVPGDAAADSRAVTVRYGLLLATVFISLAVQGIVPPSGVEQVAVAALGGASLLLAFRAADMGRRVLAVAAVAACIVVALAAAGAVGGGIGEGAARLMNAVLVAFGPPAVALGVIREVRATGRVRLQAVMGVLALYVLLGMLFAFVYGAIDHLGGPRSSRRATRRRHRVACTSASPH